MSRYKAVGDWDERAKHVAAIDTTEDGDVVHATIIVEVADIIDTKHYDRCYVNGAYRVRLKNVAGMRSKTFYGDFAHDQARSYANDAARLCGDRWFPDL